MKTLSLMASDENEVKVHSKELRLEALEKDASCVQV